MIASYGWRVEEGKRGRICASLAKSEEFVQEKVGERTMESCGRGNVREKEKKG